MPSRAGKARVEVVLMYGNGWIAAFQPASGRQGATRGISEMTRDKKDAVKAKDIGKGKDSSKAKDTAKVKIPKGPPVGSEANASKRFESERISSHIADFERSGGKVEILGVTRVLQKIADTPEAEAAAAAKAPLPRKR